MFTHLQKRGIPVSCNENISHRFLLSLIQVYVWILNNEQEFDYAFNKMGATGVMTDYPTLLQRYLASNRPNFIL